MHHGDVRVEVLSVEELLAALLASVTPSIISQNEIIYIDSVL